MYFINSDVGVLNAQVVCNLGPNETEREGLHFVDMFQYILGRRRGIPSNRTVLTNHWHIEYKLSRPKGIHHNLVLLV